MNYNTIRRNPWSCAHERGYFHKQIFLHIFCLLSSCKHPCPMSLLLTHGSGRCQQDACVNRPFSINVQIVSLRNRAAVHCHIIQHITYMTGFGQEPIRPLFVGQPWERSLFCCRTTHLSVVFSKLRHQLI